MCTKTLALGLVMFFAVGCNDQGIPTEASIPALDVPTPRPAVVFNDWIPGTEEIWDGTGTGDVASNCGEFLRLQCERDHIIEKVTETPSGHFKYSFHISGSRCRIVGLTSGREWVLSPSPYTFWFKTKDASPAAYHEHQIARSVGRGVNTDVPFRSMWRIHVNILDSGETVVDKRLTENVCGKM
jgi:hypothetical protein